MQPVEATPASPPSAHGRFSTEALPHHTRLHSWHQFVRSTFVDVQVQPERTDDFSAAADYCQLGDLRLGMLRSSRSAVRHLAQQADSRAGHFMLHLQQRGVCEHAQAGSRAVLTAGQLSLSDMARPYRVEVSDDNRMLLAVLPADALQARVPGIADLVCQPVGCEQRSAALLGALLSTAMAQQQQHPGLDPVDGPFTDMALDLLAAALQPRQPGDAAGAARRQKIQQALQQHLADPTLRVASVAASLGMSVRQVQRALAEAGTTFSLYLLEQRLQAARRRLIREGRAARITQVALDCGFNDLTYFGRTFKRRFGLPPRQLKADVQADTQAECPQATT